MRAVAGVSCCAAALDLLESDPRESDPLGSMVLRSERTRFRRIVQRPSEQPMPPRTEHRPSDGTAPEMFVFRTRPRSRRRPRRTPDLGLAGSALDRGRSIGLPQRPHGLDARRNVDFTSGECQRNGAG